MTTAFHAWAYGRFIEIQSKLRRIKFYRTNQNFDFLAGSSFSNRDNIRPPIQFRRASQPQHLRRWFSHKNRPIHSHINSTSVIWPVKLNQLSFFSIEINKPIPAPVHSLSKIRFKFRNQFYLVFTNRFIFFTKDL